MFIIPVIDLKAGQVVRARRGERQAYRPIVSALADGSDPVTLARALCHHAAGDRLYVADLDALMGGAPQVEVLRSLLRALSRIEVWLDGGFADVQEAEALCRQLGAEDANRIVPVFGSETLHSEAPLPERSLLSLDRRDGRRLDAAGWWDAIDRWPSRVIAMTLEQVGADTGPDLVTIASLRERSPATQLFGAGGIRDAADLEHARAAGAQGWLVASALHDGRLPPPP